MPASGDTVRSITGSTLTDLELQPFLDGADCIMERVSTCTTNKGVSSSCLDLAASYLASHLLSLSTVGKDSRTKKRETFENYTVEYAVAQVMGNGVMSTQYGQTANSILGGCLQEVDKQQANICFFGGA
jgi:hypothetical protein